MFAADRYLRRVHRFTVGSMQFQCPSVHCTNWYDCGFGSNCGCIQLFSRVRGPLETCGLVCCDLGFGNGEKNWLHNDYQYDLDSNPKCAK